MSTERFMLIWIDGLDWILARAAAHDGRAPTLARLLLEGAQAVRADGTGIMRDATFASGQPPLVHGLMSVAVPRPDGMGLDYPCRDAWAAPPIWDRAASSGHEVAVLNFPATRFSAPPGGSVVADIAFSDYARRSPVEGLPPGSVFPPETGPDVAAHFLAPDMIAEDAVRAMLPQDTTRAPQVEMRRWLAEIASLQTLALRAWTQRQPRLLCLRFHSPYSRTNTGHAYQSSETSTPLPLTDGAVQMIDACLANLLSQGAGASVFVAGARTGTCWISGTSAARPLLGLGDPAAVIHESLGLGRVSEAEIEARLPGLEEIGAQIIDTPDRQSRPLRSHELEVQRHRDRMSLLQAKALRHAF